MHFTYIELVYNTANAYFGIFVLNAKYFMRLEASRSNGKRV